jgi:hypothetical protein
MPATALERGLADPFDPEEAIPKAAGLLADLDLRFGNIGLALAAYHAGPGRVGNWLSGGGVLPVQTQAYVFNITGRSAADWASDRQASALADNPRFSRPCLEITATLRTKAGDARLALVPNGNLVGVNFLTSIALASFERARQRYCRKIRNDWSHDVRLFHRVLAPTPGRPSLEARDLLPPLCTS